MAHARLPVPCRTIRFGVTGVTLVYLDSEPASIVRSTCLFVSAAKAAIISVRFALHPIRFYAQQHVKCGKLSR